MMEDIPLEVFACEDRTQGYQVERSKVPIRVDATKMPIFFEKRVQILLTSDLKPVNAIANSWRYTACL